MTISADGEHLTAGQIIEAVAKSDPDIKAPEPATPRRKPTLLEVSYALMEIRLRMKFGGSSLSGKDADRAFLELTAEDARMLENASDIIDWLHLERLKQKNKDERFRR